MKILVNSKTPVRVVLSSGLTGRFFNALKKLVLHNYNNMCYAYADSYLAEDLLRWAYANNVSTSSLILALDHAASTKYNYFPTTGSWLRNYVLFDNQFFCRTSNIYKEYKYYYSSLCTNSYRTTKVKKQARFTSAKKTKTNKNKGKKELVVKLPKNTDINSIRIKLV